MDVRIVPLHPRHAAIVPYLRRADVDEIWASCGLRPEIAVAYSVAMSNPGWAVELAGRPVAVFGAQTVSGGVGVPWLVGTGDIEEHPIHFYRISKKLVAEMKERFNYMENWTDARNVLSIRWLEWSGFTVEPSEPWGAAGLQFHRFWWAGSRTLHP